jgi:hypothetical protein
MAAAAAVGIIVQADRRQGGGGHGPFERLRRCDLWDGFQCWVFGEAAAA